jgi:hypothetical protein
MLQVSNAIVSIYWVWQLYISDPILLYSNWKNCSVGTRWLMCLHRLAVLSQAVIVIHCVLWLQ